MIYYNRFNEFGTDGGPAAKELVPKFTAFTKNLSAKLGVVVPEIDVRPPLEWFCSSLASILSLPVSDFANVSETSFTG